ncbi:hypothetical protein BDU57DRAFT_517884 [Ampelomyces quisqualis]|uniref:Peptidase inhibitor I78 family-domain-containing protein n=1 Tax=Ampelomyces quisqualis TaxID=50730 RepID=A0A6A5QJS6_AMPQU|nr:hypothetical protein BDU57DRAFT_517884 [Ampelomyces quisqualis]
MPLVVPGLMSKDASSSSSSDDWLSKLAGKKIGEQHDETTFAKTDLPQEHRVLKPDDMKTMDFKPDRLNIHVGDDGVVKEVTKG